MTLVRNNPEWFEVKPTVKRRTKKARRSDVSDAQDAAILQRLEKIKDESKIRRERIHRLVCLLDEIPQQKRFCVGASKDKVCYFGKREVARAKRFLNKLTQLKHSKEKLSRRFYLCPACSWELKNDVYHITTKAP